MTNDDTPLCLENVLDLPAGRDFLMEFLLDLEPQDFDDLMAEFGSSGKDLLRALWDRWPDIEAHANITLRKDQP